MEKILKPDDLKQISADAEMAEIKAALAKKQRVEKTADDLKQTFESREVAPQATERINAAVRAAAQRGVREILVIQFPATYCNDGGRSINNIEPDWPNSLEGFGKRAYDYFEKELRPLGFKLRAEIVSFPDGVPGDVGLFLRW